MKKTLPFKTIKKKIALVDTRPDLYLILRFLCIPLEKAHEPLVVHVPHFENRWSRLMLVCSVNAVQKPVGCIIFLLLLFFFIKPL